LFEVPGPSVDALIWLVPVTVRLAAGMKEAIPPVPMNIVAGRGLPFHCVTEQGDKPFPFKVSAIGGPVCASVAALVGEIELMTGVGRVVPVANAVTENGSEFEFVAGFGPDTVIATAAGALARKAVSAGVMAAVSCVALTKVVGRGEPFQLTVRPLAKFVPFTVSVKPDALQKGVLLAVVVDAESEVTVANLMSNGN
jgi:hypothetical protein